MIKAVIFDVDGVLLDSFESNLEYFQNIMKLAGYEGPTREDYALLFHRTLRDTIAALAHTDDEEIGRIYQFIDIAETQEPILAHGALETLEKLSKTYVLAVVTSRIKAHMFESPLNALEHYFKTAIAYEDTENHKPDPEPLLLAADQLGVSPEECVYIGDVMNDFIAARSAGMRFILYSKEEMEDIDVAAANFHDLPDLIKKFDA